MIHKRFLRIFAFFILFALPLSLFAAPARAIQSRMNIFYLEELGQESIDNLSALVSRIENRIDDNIAVAVRKYSAEGELQFSLTANDDRLYPIASGFKGFLGLYYLLITPEEEWEIEPGSAMYSMMVFSNNNKTARILDQVGLENFNDFLINVMGLENGIGRWGYGTIHEDNRYRYRPERAVVLDGGKTLEVDNVMTLSDLIKGYEFFIKAPQTSAWNNGHFRKAVRTAQDLMAVRAEEYPTPFEALVRVPYSYGKDGALRPDDGLGEFVINETMVLEAPDGSNMMVSLMTVGVNHGIFQFFAERILTWVPEIENSLASESYQLDFSAYPELKELETGGTYFGFVEPSKVTIYYDTHFDSRLENYFRGSYTMPVAYLFQGGLVRFELLEDGWVRVIKNSPRKVSYVEMITTPHGGEVYLRLEDLHVVDYERFTRIDPIFGEGNSKFIVIDKYTNTLTLLEGSNVVLNTPVVLNHELTEEGMHLINTNMPTLDMPYYPAVPFVMNFGLNKELGLQAIHGAPWQKASISLRDGVAHARTTGGCVNLPNWVVPIGDYELPVDEFIFRWSGGMNDPLNIYEQRNDSVENVVRVIIVNGYEALYNYARTIQTGMGIPPSELIELIKTTPLNVPDSYWR